MRKRTGILFVVMLFLMSGLIFRVYDINGQQLSQAAERQASTSVTAGTARGTIYDSELRPLVNDTYEYRAAAIPSPQAVGVLQQCVDGDIMDSLAERIRTGKPVTAKLNREGLLSSASGLYAFRTPVRYGEWLPAPHVVGYVGDGGVKGVAGAELYFDEPLAAASGKVSVTYTVDATGRALQGMPSTVDDTLDDAKAGVVLTIDRDIQLIAEKAAKNHITKGAVVVMRPDTGHIAAMVSLPDFQPGTVADNLNNPDSPLLNRATSNYNFGSIFKIVVTAAALEAKIPTSTAFDCTGSVTVGSVTFHCHHRLGHGVFTMPRAFAMSCNPYYIRLGQQVGGTRLYNMAVLLGFDRAIYLADGWKTARAVLPAEQELVSPAAVGNLAIGQGALMATPVHAAQLVGAVVNGGSVVRPTLYKGAMAADGTFTPEEIAPRQTAFSEKTAATIRGMMVETMENGTGKQGRPAYGAGGKTGTAETGWISQESGDTVVQGWMAGYYPAEDPRYVIVVLVEDTNGSGGKAAPVFREIGNELSVLEDLRERQGVTSQTAAG